MKDWRADYERHISLGFSVGNIKGFSTAERTLFITHGYGHVLPIQAREVFVRDDRCFGMDWVESTQDYPSEHSVNTAKLSTGMEGISKSILNEYLDRHIDGGFEAFVDDYFEGTLFLTPMLKTAYRYWYAERTPVIRKSLKLLLAYNLTQHVTMVEGIPNEEGFLGRIEDTTSKFYGKTVAPVIINFEIKCAMAEMWRELQKEILEELSQLYSSVYTKDKLRHWPTIFMVASILLAVWEEMQFDCHYRIPVSSTPKILNQSTMLTMSRIEKLSANSVMTWKKLLSVLLLVSSRPFPRNSHHSKNGTPHNIITCWAQIWMYAMLWRKSDSM